MALRRRYLLPYNVPISRHYDFINPNLMVDANLGKSKQNVLTGTSQNRKYLCYNTNPDKKMFLFWNMKPFCIISIFYLWSIPMFLSERPCLIISYGRTPQVTQLTGVDTIIDTCHAMGNFSKRQSDNILLIFFSRKQILTLHANLSPLETICLKYQNLFSGKISKIFLIVVCWFFPAC